METIVPTKVLFYFALPEIFSTGVNQSITMSKNQFTKISQTRTDLLSIKFCPYFENICAVHFSPMHIFCARFPPRFPRIFLNAGHS